MAGAVTIPDVSEREDCTDPWTWNHTLSHTWSKSERVVGLSFHNLLIFGLFGKINTPPWSSSADVDFLIVPKEMHIPANCRSLGTEMQFQQASPMIRMRNRWFCPASDGLVPISRGVWDGFVALRLQWRCVGTLKDRKDCWLWNLGGDAPSTII